MLISDWSSDGCCSDLLEAERMGGIGDALVFGAGEMAFEPARLLRQYAAGRGDLDDAGAGARRLADLFGAFERAGAGVARVEDVVDILAEAGDVPVAADDRQRRAGGDDPQALDKAAQIGRTAV